MNRSQTAPNDRGATRHFPLAVVILHHGDAALTRSCVASVQKTGVRGTRVYVVDGAGAGPFPRGPHRVVTIDPHGALGFSARCNLAAGRALDEGAGALLFLNNDATIAPETPAQLLAFVHDTGAGIAAPVVLSLSDPGVVESAGISFNRATGRAVHAFAGAPYRAVWFEYRFVDAVAGTCMLVTRAAAQAVSPLFDPGLTFYFEDVDLCLRAASAGVRIAVVKEARVWHIGAASFRGARAAERARLATRHHLTVCARHGRPLPAPLRFARDGHIILLNAAYFALRERAPFAAVAAVFRGAAEFFRER